MRSTALTFDLITMIRVQRIDQTGVLDDFLWYFAWKAETVGVHIIEFNYKENGRSVKNYIVIFIFNNDVC
jgi:hypothetical protein